MLKHNLTLIFRILWSRKIYSLIILLSLTVGFVCTNILISFLVYETNTDSFHAKRDRLFQVFSNDPFGGQGQVAYIPDYFFEYLTKNYAEISNVCQIANLDGITIQKGNERYDDFKILTVDSSFFTMFDFPLMQGRRDQCLQYDNLVLTKNKALILFGKTDVIGNLITVSTADTTRQLVISAVVDKPVENSHLVFDALVHHSTFREKWNGGATYALLTSVAARGPLSEKIHKDDQRPGLIGLGKMQYFFNPLSDSYFNLDNKAGYMKTRNPMLLKVAYVACALVLFIASFNFINLVLLSWQNRRKEIGIKKTLGVSRSALFRFSISEAAVYVLIGFLFSLAITFYIIPLFNSVFQSSVPTSYFLNVKVISSIGAMLFLIGALVVVFAVARQWSMKPISLMGVDASKVRFSRGLFTVQFVISITLAICAVTIVKQMKYLEQAPLGFNRHIIQLNSPDKKLSAGLSVLKDKVLQLPGISNAAVSSGNPIFGNSIARYELGNDQFYTPYLFTGDEDFLKTLDLKLIEGEMPSEKNTGKLVNQTLVKHFNLKDPVGEFIPGTKDVIAGVVEDFTCVSFKQQIPPAIISHKAGGQALLVDYRGSDIQNIMAPLAEAWKNVFPDNPFSYRVMQEELMKKYKEDTFFYKIVITFSIVSMVLSCFGLFALSWAVVQSRTKEMGIRKVLGATALDILNLLTMTFTKRILLAFAVAAPLGYYLMNDWLTRFVNRIELTGSIFIVSAAIVLFVAVLTLSLQTIKAALTNPVDEIRNQ